MGRVALGSGVTVGTSASPDGYTPAEIQTRSFKDFSVLERVRKKIVKKVGNRQPSIDAFADSKNNQFPRFWTQRDSAWDKDWNLERLLWINAPFDQLGKVAQKIVDDQAKAVVIAPKWTHKSWWNRLDLSLIHI